MTNYYISSGDILDWISVFLKQRELLLLIHNGKTEIMLISSMHVPPVEFPQFLVGDEIIMPAASSIRNLGVQFDSKMRLDKQITSIFKMSFVNVKDIIRFDHVCP